MTGDTPSCTIELVSTVETERTETEAHSGESSAPGYEIARLRFLRFLLVGAASTLLTGLLMLAIAQLVELEIAYTIVFALGLTFTTAVVGPFVFRSQLTGRAARRFVSWYLCVYLVGVLVAHLAGHQWHVSHLVATAAVLTVTAPLNFLGGSRAFAAPP